MAKILLADDERDVVTLIKFLLEKDGHSVVEAFNGAQVVALLGIDPPRQGAERPDMIILDVMMPEVDGYTVARRLLEDDELRSVPVLVLTAKGKMRELFQVCPNVVEYLEKPFDPSKLRELVGRALKAKA